MNVELREGLMQIIEEVFHSCTSLESISIPSSVRDIGLCAFIGCTQLMNVELMEGLRCIIAGAFGFCTSLESISIPSSVRDIGPCALNGCTQLMYVELCDGMEYIREEAFFGCTSLRSISIPSTVKRIHRTAFKECSNLVAIDFCEDIEEFITESSLLHWWNNGTSELSLSTASFLAHCNIPRRVGYDKHVGVESKDSCHVAAYSFCGFMH